MTQDKFTLHEVVNDKGIYFIYLRKNDLFVDCVSFNPSDGDERLKAIKKMVELADSIKNSKASDTLIATL